MTNSGDFEISVKKRTMPYEIPGDIPSYVLDSGQNFTLYITDIALIRMRQVSQADPKREIGGVLLGVHYQRGSRVVVEITKALELPSSNTSITHYEFDSQALLSLHSNLANDTELYVVGWFHSHVGLGDPFMSGFDTTLHSSHFPKHWHVSAVVVGGQPGWPIGFWRMEGDDLIEIPEYFTKMTYGDPIGEPTARYYNSLKEEQLEINVFIDTISTILDDLGFSNDHLIRKVLRDQNQKPDPETDPDRAMHRSYYNTFLKILQIASSLNNSENVVAIKECLDRMSHVISGNRNWHRCFVTHQLGPMGMIRYGAGIGFSKGGKIIEVWDLIYNQFVDFGLLEGGVTLIDGDFLHEEGTVLLLTEDKKIIQIPPDFGKDMLARGQLSIQPKALKLGGDFSKPSAMMVRGQTLYIVAGEKIVTFSFETTAGSQGLLELVRESIKPKSELSWGGPEQGEVCLLKGNLAVTGEEEELVLAVKTKANKLALHLFGPGAPLVRAGDLPKQTQDWHLKQALIWEDSIFVLFDDDSFGQLLEFNYYSLSLKRHFVQDVPPKERKQLHSIVHEAEGTRVYLRVGDELRLIGTTGSLDKNWHHSRKLVTNISRLSHIGM